MNLRIAGPHCSPLLPLAACRLPLAVPPALVAVAAAAAAMPLALAAVAAAVMALLQLPPQPVLQPLLPLRQPLLLRPPSPLPLVLRVARCALRAASRALRAACSKLRCRGELCHYCCCLLCVVAVGPSLRPPAPPAPPALPGAPVPPPPPTGANCRHRCRPGYAGGQSAPSSQPTHTVDATHTATIPTHARARPSSF